MKLLFIVQALVNEDEYIQNFLLGSQYISLEWNHLLQNILKNS
jgi:hypothetical protein